MNSFDKALADFLKKINLPEHSFADSLAFIDNWFEFTPCEFNNNGLINSASENHGSAKIFALAQMLNLNKQQALLCFGEHYRNLSQTSKDSHLNIRRLIATDLAEIAFSQPPLQRK
ncbi:MAG TPA: HopJ type III effector protein [Pseudomonadales bacterium]|nr:HopJ type III effector protein [Pseudomonadales bacterium]